MATDTNLRNAKKIIEMMIKLKKSAILMGSPGIGKTEVIESVCRNLTYKDKKTGKTKPFGFRCFEASSLDPMDARGVLIPKGDQTFFTKSPLLPDVEKHGECGVLLIDELPSGLPAVQVALHSLFHPKERRIGEHTLPEGWIPMATGNYASDGAGASNLLSALGDRVNIINVKEDYQVWKEDYAIPKKLHPVVMGLLNFREDLFCTFEDRNKGEKGKGFVTPRTHTQISEILYENDAHPLGDEAMFVSIAGYAGDAVATQYTAFSKTYAGLPDPEKIYKGEDIIVPSDEPSLLYALCSALVAKARTIDMPKTKAMDRMLQYSLKLEAEFGGLLIRDLYAENRDAIVKSKRFSEVADRYF